MNELDLLLLVGASGMGYLGYRQGFVVGLLSLLGFVGGGTLALLIAPKLVGKGAAGRNTSLAAVGAVLFCAAAGQILLGGYVGQQVRGRITRSAVRRADAVVGSAVSVVALLLVSWFFASALRPGPVPALSRQISESAVVTTVDDVMPDGAHTTFSAFRRVLDENALPPVFAGLEAENIRPVEPPAHKVALTAFIQEAARSVVEVRSTASECDRRVKGTGFVFAPQHVMTNAHVVSGVRRPQVIIGGEGRRYPARVVAYDSDRDLAVLYVPALTAPALTFRGGAKRGDDAVVAGFPQGGPFELEAARIREVITARGPDIYQSHEVDREVFSLYADVEPGNSGGPLLSPRGEVYGVIFAKSLDDPDTGYALTAEEVAPVVARGRAATRAVATGACV